MEYMDSEENCQSHNNYMEHVTSTNNNDDMKSESDFDNLDE